MGNITNIRSGGQSGSEPGRSKQYLYVIGQLDGDAYTFFKFGISRNPKARLSTLQTGSPLPLWIINVIEANPWTVEMERFIHTLLSPYRVSGEWFRATDEVNAFIDLLGLFKYNRRVEEFSNDGDNPELTEWIENHRIPGDEDFRWHEEKFNGSG